MQWTWLTDETGWRQLLAHSEQCALVVFKHSHRCSLSSIVKHRLDGHATNPELTGWIIDVVAERELARLIANELEVNHASPQVLIIKNQECIWDEDHLDIYAEEVEGILREATSTQP